MAAVALDGCSDDVPPTSTEAPATDPPAVNTPDDVVSAFRQAWNGRDASAVASVLGDGFIFHLSPTDIDTADVPRSWARSTHLRAVGNIFAGETGVRPDGTPQPSVDTLSFFGLTLVPDRREWTPVEGPGLDGMLRRDYLSVMTASYTDLDFDFVEGRQSFYVREEADTDAEGNPIRRYRLQVWKDLGSDDKRLGRRHRVLTWGYFLALYREVHGAGSGESTSTGLLPSCPRSGTSPNCMTYEARARPPDERVHPSPGP